MTSLTVSFLTHLILPSEWKPYFEMRILNGQSLPFWFRSSWFSAVRVS